MANPALMRIAVVVLFAVIAALLWPHVHSAIVRNSSSYQQDLVVNCATLDLSADLDTGSRRASNDCHESVDRKHGL